MFPWLFLFAPQYHIDFSPKLRIDSSHEKLWDIVYLVTNQNAALTKKNTELTTQLIKSNLLATNSLQSTIAAFRKSGLKDDDLAELQQHLEILTKNSAAL